MDNISSRSSFVQNEFWFQFHQQIAANLCIERSGEKKSRIVSSVSKTKLFIITNFHK